jgi:hypothetical protein
MITAHAATEHGAHAAVIVLPVAFLALVILRERQRTRPPGSRSARCSWGRRAVLGGTAAAAAGHASAVPAHLPEQPLHALLFAGAALAQVVAAAAYARWGTFRVLLLLGTGQVALLGLWLVSRTTGLPWGPGAWAREPIGALDGLVVAAEASAVWGLLLLARPRRSGARTGAEQLEPHGLATAVGEGPPPVRDGLHDRHPAPGLTLV